MPLWASAAASFSVAATDMWASFLRLLIHAAASGGTLSLPAGTAPPKLNPRCASGVCGRVKGQYRKNGLRFSMAPDMNDSCCGWG